MHDVVGRRGRHSPSQVLKQAPCQGQVTRVPERTPFTSGAPTCLQAVRNEWGMSYHGCRAGVGSNDRNAARAVAGPLTGTWNQWRGSGRRRTAQRKRGHEQARGSVPPSPVAQAAQRTYGSTHVDEEDGALLVQLDLAHGVGLHVRELDARVDALDRRAAAGALQGANDSASDVSAGETACARVSHARWDAAARARRHVTCKSRHPPRTRGRRPQPRRRRRPRRSLSWRDLYPSHLKPFCLWLCSNRTQRVVSMPGNLFPTPARKIARGQQRTSAHNHGPAAMREWWSLHFLFWRVVVRWWGMAWA